MEGMGVVTAVGLSFQCTAEAKGSHFDPNFYWLVFTQYKNVECIIAIKEYYCSNIFCTI